MNMDPVSRLDSAGASWRVSRRSAKEEQMAVVRARGAKLKLELEQTVRAGLVLGELAR